MTGYNSKKAMNAELAREEMVAYLCESDFQYIMHSDGGLELLDSYLRDGFKGYDAYTQTELEVEYAQRKEMANE
jgi:hypothetical protein